MAQKIEVQLLDLNTKDILIDDLGQRDVNRRRAQFNKIMRTFDPNLIQPISVALIDRWNQRQQQSSIYLHRTQ